MSPLQWIPILVDVRETMKHSTYILERIFNTPVVGLYNSGSQVNPTSCIHTRKRRVIHPKDITSRDPWGCLLLGGIHALWCFT